MNFKYKGREREYKAEWRKAHPEVDRLYHRKYVSQGVIEYVGVIESCPKCGKRGYKRYRRKYNSKTKVFHKWETWVFHQHKEKGKTRHDGVCYIGVGRL